VIKVITYPIIQYCTYDVESNFGRSKKCNLLWPTLSTKRRANLKWLSRFFASKFSTSNWHFLKTFKVSSSNVNYGNGSCSSALPFHFPSSTWERRKENNEMKRQIFNAKEAFPISLILTFFSNRVLLKYITSVNLGV